VFIPVEKNQTKKPVRTRCETRTLTGPVQTLVVAVRATGLLFYCTARSPLTTKDPRMFQAIAKRRIRFNSRSNRECLKQRQGFRLRRVGLETLEPRRVLSSVSWTGGGDGHSWGDTANWSSGALPGATDDVTISVAGPLTITHASGSDSIRSIIESDLVNGNYL
jgi:hypothetical protein